MLIFSNFRIKKMEKFESFFKGIDKDYRQFGN